MTKTQYEEIIKNIQVNMGTSYSLVLHMDNSETIMGKAEILGSKTLVVKTSTQQIQYVDLDKVSWISTI